MRQDGNNDREESLRFVVSHWQKDAFNVSRDWDELGLVRRSWWRRNAAAAAIGGVALAACAALGTWMLVSESGQTPVLSHPAGQPIEISADPMTESRRIEFTDATLQEVADAVRRVYGVRLQNLPPDAGRITLSYEGTAPELVETLNFMLGSSISIAPLSEESEDNPNPRQK